MVDQHERDLKHEIQAAINDHPGIGYIEVETYGTHGEYRAIGVISARGRVDQPEDGERLAAVDTLVEDPEEYYVLEGQGLEDGEMEVADPVEGGLTLQEAVGLAADIVHDNE